MFSRSFKRVGLHYTAFRNAIREDSRQTAPSRGVSPRKKFAVEANVESRAKHPALSTNFVSFFISRILSNQTALTDDNPTFCIRFSQNAAIAIFSKYKI